MNRIWNCTHICRLVCSMLIRSQHTSGNLHWHFRVDKQHSSLLIFSSPVAGGLMGKVKQQSALASWLWTDRLSRCVWDLGRAIYSVWPSLTSFIGPIRKMSVCQEGVLQRKGNLWTSDGISWFSIQFLCSLRGTWALNRRSKTGREGVRDIARLVKSKLGQFGTGQFGTDQTTPVRCCQTPLSFHWNICIIEVLRSKCAVK